MTGLAVRRGIDGAVVAYLAALVIAAVQVVVLDAPGRIGRGAAPYLAALGAVILVRRLAPAGDDQVEAWIRVLAGGGVALAVWVLGAFVAALPVGIGEPSGFYTVKALVTTPVGDHNTAAGLLLPPAAAAAVAASRDRRWTAALAVIGVGIVGTLSRGAAVVLVVVAVASWPLVSDRAARLRLLVTAAGALALVLLAAVWLGAAPPEPAQQEAVLTASAADGRLGASVVARGDLIGRGVEVGLRHPVLGVGLGGFGDEAGDLPPPNHHAHNLVAHAFAEAGIGLAAVAVALPVILAVRLRRLGPGRLRDVLLVGGAGLVLQAQHDIMGGLAGYEVLLAVLIGLAAAPVPGRRHTYGTVGS